MYSFGIKKAPLDFFKKLEDEYNDYQEDMLSTRIAINFALTA